MQHDQTRQKTASRKAAAMLFLAAAAALAISGCQMVHGLGSDLQSISEFATTRVFVDDPASD